MNKIDHLRVSHLVHILDALRGSCPNMPLQRAVTLLHIALKPGLAVTGLARAVDADRKLSHL